MIENSINKKWQSSLLKIDSSIKDVMKNLDQTSLKIAIIIDDDNKLAGTISDGDIRRGLLNHLDINSNIEKIINKNPLYVKSDFNHEDILELMKTSSLHQIPIVDKNKRVIGIHLINQENTVQELNNTILIMAGGRGKRMLPHTKDTPKPMLRVHGKPILEHIVVRAKNQGFRNFFISVHYLASSIKEYFGDGKKFGVNIKYIEEKDPLGTVGAVALIDPQPKDSIVVTNGDLITSVKYNDFLSYHRENNAVASMSVFSYEFENPFGIVKTDGIDIKGFEEKPLSKHNVNAGVYVFQPEVINLLKKHEKCDIPELFNNLQNMNKKIIAYFIHEKWSDIGRPEDLIRINNI